MEDTSATANPSAEEKDSAINPSEETLNPEGHSEEATETEEETSENNEESLEDPEGAPEGESEEDLDPLIKAKKHADRKIAELGEKASTGEKMLVAAVTKNPDLLIEMYDPSSELYNRKLADKISQEKPEVYARANAVYMQRKNGVAPATPAQNPYQGPVTDAMLEQKISEYLTKHQQIVAEQAVIQEFKNSIGLSDEQFEVIEPSLRAIASSIRQADETVDEKSSFRRAFLAMFPGDYDKSIRQKTILDAAKKKAMTSPAGAGESPSSDNKNRKLSKQEEAGWKASGLPLERYMQLQEKYFKN